MEWRVRSIVIEAMRTLLLLLACAASLPAATPIRVMLLDGESAGTYHAWRETTPVLKRELEEAGLFQVEVVTAPPSGGDFSNFKPDFAKYAVVVLNLDSATWPLDLETAFEQYMKNGGGFVAVHAADNAFPDWQAFNDMIGVGGWRGRRESAGPHWFYKDGKMESDTTPGPAGSHGDRLPFQITIRDTEHPVTKGLPRVWMHAGRRIVCQAARPRREHGRARDGLLRPCEQWLRPR